MFKAIKDNKIIAVNDSGVFPCLVYDEAVEDTEHNVEDYQHYNGEFVLDLPIEEKQAQVRAVRNQYLEDTDLYMLSDFPIDSGTRHNYTVYRTMLRNFTITDKWWEEKVPTFEEFMEILIGE